MNNTFYLDRTYRVTTIIALVFEGIGVLSLVLAKIFFSFLLDFIISSDDSLTPSDIEEIEWMMNFYSVIILVFLVILGILFVVNLILFIKLLRNQYSKKQAKKVMLYMAIIGGFYLLSNQIVGVLYLVTGIVGYNEQKELSNIREGI